MNLHYIFKGLIWEEIINCVKNLFKKLLAPPIEKKYWSDFLVGESSKENFGKIKTKKNFS